MVETVRIKITSKVFEDLFEIISSFEFSSYPDSNSEFFVCFFLIQDCRGFNKIIRGRERVEKNIYYLLFIPLSL